MQDTLERGERYEARLRGQRWNRAPLRLDVRVVRLPAAWRPGTWLLAARDVTREHAEIVELVERGEGVERIMSLFEEIGYSGELLPNGDLVLHFVGPGLERLLGVSFRDDENPESLWKAMIHPDDVAVFHSRDEELRRGLPAEVEYRLCRPNGEERTIIERMRPTLQPDGRVRMDGVVIDVTDNRPRRTP